MVVHHLRNSRSQRILWLLEELGVAHEVRTYDRDPKTLLAPSELRAVHPLGKAPVLTDGEVTIAESGAIIEYVVGRYGDGRLVPPAGAPERIRYTYWLHYAEGSAMPPLVMQLVFNRVRNAPMPFFVRPVARTIVDRVKRDYLDPQIDRHLSFMEGELGKSPWFAGDEFTAADIQMMHPVASARARAGLSETTHPHLSDWLDRVESRPAYKRALQRGGPFKILEG
ncbi:MAG: glutathione S-transferase [Polyangiaceae bacterium]